MPGQEVASLYAKIGADTTEVKRGLTETRTGVREAAKDFGNLKAAIGGAVAAFAVQQTLAFAKSMVQLGAATQEAERRFVRLSGADLASGLNELRTATKGAVDDMTLMESSNKFMQMGLAKSTAEASKLAQMALVLGGATQEAQTGFALMLSNQSIMRLDNYGISAGQVRERIKELQDATPGLTRETAFMQAVMEQGALAVDRLGGMAENASTKLARIGATMANVKASIGKGFAEAFAGSDIGPQLQQIAEDFGKLATSSDVQAALKGVANAIAELLSIGQQALSWFINLDPAARKMALTMGGIAIAIPMVTTAWGALNMVMVANPIVAVTMALLAAAPALAAVRDSIKQTQEAGQSQIATLAQSAISYESFIAEAMKLAQANQLIPPALKTQQAALAYLKDQGIIPTLAEWQAMNGAFAQTQSAVVGATTGFAFLKAEMSGALDVTHQVDQAAVDMAAQMSQSQTAWQNYAQSVQQANTLVAQAIVSKEVQAAMGEFRKLIDDHQKQIALSQEQFQSSQTEASFSHNVQLLQAQQQYQQQYNALLAAGKGDEAAQLTSKYEQQTGLSNSQFKVQQQLAERANLVQRLTQAKGYLEQLKDQADKVKQTLYMAVFEAAKKDGIISAGEMAILSAIKTAGSARLQQELTIGEKSNKIAEETAKGNFDAAHQQWLAMQQLLANNEAAAQAEIDKIKSSLEHFTITLPPLPTLDLSGIAGAGGGAAAAERASEPITRTLTQVVEDIGRGITAAKDAIRQLLKFDLPAGVETGLDKLGEFITLAVDRFYAVAMPMEDKLKEVQEKIEPIQGIVQIIGQTMDVVGRMGAEAPTPDIKMWLGGTELAINEMVATLGAMQARFTEAHTDVEQLGRFAQTLKPALDLFGTDLSKAMVPKDVNVGAWASWLTGLIYSIKDVFDQVSSKLSERQLDDMADMVGQIQAVVALVNVNLGSMSMPAKGLVMTDWENAVIAAVLSVRNVRDTIASQLPPARLTEIGESVALLKPILELIGVGLGSMSVPAKGFNLDDWENWVTSAILGIRNVVTQVKRGLTADQLTETRDAVAVLKPILDLLGVSLGSMSMPPKGFDMAVWGVTVTTAVNEIRKAVGTLQKGITIEELASLKESTALVKSILDVIGVNFGAMTMPPKKFDFRAWGKTVVQAFFEVKSAVAEIKKTVTDDELKSVSESVGMLGKIGDLLGIDFSKLMPPPPNFSAILSSYFEGLKRALKLAIPMIQDIQATLGTDVLTAVSKAAEELKPILELFGFADSFAKLKEMQNVNVAGLMAIYAQQLKRGLELMLPIMTDIQAQFGAVITEAAKTATDSATLIGAFASISESINKAWEGGGINVAMLATLMNQFRRAAAIMGAGSGANLPAAAAEILPPVPTGMPEIIPAPKGGVGAPVGQKTELVIKVNVGLGKDFVPTITAVLEQVKGLAEGMYVSMGQEGVVA